MQALEAYALNVAPEVKAVIEAGLREHAAKSIAEAHAATALTAAEQSDVDHNALRRFRKLNPTLFYHRERQDPIDWMYDLEKLMDLAELPNEATKLAAMPLVLADRALIWWKGDEKSGTLPEYFTGEGGYKEYFLAHHSAPDPARKIRDQLDELKQTGSVSRYTAQFRSLMARAQMTDEEINHKYVKHLKEDVRKQVVLNMSAGLLPTFEKIADYAEKTDAILYENRRRNTRPPPSEAHRDSSQRYQTQRHNQPRYPPNNSDNNGAAPMDLSAMPPGEKLSPELKIKLIREGKCFYCRTGTHLAINCPLKQKHRSPNGPRQ